MEWIFILLFATVNFNLVNPIGVPENVTIGYPCTDQNHVFLIPGMLSAGGSSRACVSRFQPRGPVRMVLTLYTEKQPAVTAVREMTEGNGGCIDVAIPLLPNTKAEMVVNMWYPEAQCSWERRVPTRIAGARVVLALTQRARVRPGEVVRARVFLLKPDLTPAHGVIEEIWLEGPRGAWEGARAAEWRRVRTRMGVAQVQHTLDQQAPAGRWTLRVKLADGSQGSAVFHVGEYELPPFQLSVRHAPKVLSTSERLVWTVCVRYPWTEAVEGMLVIRIRGAGANSSSDGIRTAVRLRAPRACHRHAAAAKRIGLDGANSPDVVVADFSFQEESTRIWQNTTVVSHVVDKRVTVEFLTKHRAVISPWLPYKLKVKATRWDNKPAPNEVIKVCKTPASSPDPQETSQGDEICNEASTDEKGVARVLFAADNHASLFYKFLATLKNDSTISTTPLFLPIQHQGTMHAALGPLKSDGHDVRTSVPLYLSVKNVLKPLTVHFVVITRGGILYRWGATTQCPVSSSSEEAQTADPDSHCQGATRYRRANLDAADYHQHHKLNQSSSSIRNLGSTEQNTSDALSDKHMNSLRVLLPVKISHQMCPDSYLVAYFYYKGELVSANKHFEMEECFPNKVQATFLSRQAAPGSTTLLQLTTTGPALCALTALDSASKWVQERPSVKEVLLARLKRLMEAHRNLTEYDAAGECFLTSDTPSTPLTSAELTSSWLASAGIRMIGPSYKPAACPTAPAPLLAEDVTVPRSDFSEAWLWRLVAVGSNGTATVEAKAPDSITRYEASAVCVSRTGVDISQPAVLQVFREFFIHADSPKRLRRGDTSIVRYRLFNYLYEPLSVYIQVLTDPHLEGPKYMVESVCIAARTSIARRTEIKVKLPGNARVSIRAKSVKNGACGNASSERGVSDEVIIQMTVDPEGFPVQEQKSILLCGRGSLESSTSEVSWSWPAVQAVPGTEALNVWAVGNIAGPLLADADDLVMLPRGCGEQNLARIATNLLALKQLHPDTTAYAVAKQHVARGFTRQLQYAHPVGGFSAFGATDATPSTWLTAFALCYMKKAHQVLSPSLPQPPILVRAELWLLSQQMENGCFRNEGQVFHRELRGGLNEEGEIASVALTAYVITSLLESSVLPTKVIRNALSCLRALPPIKSKSPTRIYAHSLLAYAFIRLKKYEDEVKKINDASQYHKEVGGLAAEEEVRQLAELIKMAKRGGDFVWWETGSLATSIEATGYALLAVSGCPTELRGSFTHDARAAIRWLSTHRNPKGGFVATQDTLIALEALTAWSSTQPATAISLNVTASSGVMRRSVTLTTEVKIPKVMMMGSEDVLDVRVEGTGCALIQATRSYNAYSVDQQQKGKQLTVQVTVHTDGPFDCDVNRTSCYCAAVVETCVLWTGTFPEMALLEVSLPGGYGADTSLLYSQLRKEDTLLRRIEVSLTTITYYLGSIWSLAAGHHCWQTHVVGPQGRTQAAHVVLKSYYTPDVNDTKMYTIPEECPSRFAQDSNQYLPSYNLFAKARASGGSDDLIISKDLAFEDISEGIALEDPLYENLKSEDIKKKVLDKVYVGTDDAEEYKDKVNEMKSSEKLNDKYNLDQERSTSKRGDVKYNLEQQKPSSEENEFNFYLEQQQSNSDKHDVKYILEQQKSSPKDYYKDNEGLIRDKIVSKTVDIIVASPKMRTLPLTNDIGNIFKQSVAPVTTSHKSHSHTSQPKADKEVIRPNEHTENLHNENKEDSYLSKKVMQETENENRKIYLFNDPEPDSKLDPKALEVEINSEDNTKVQRPEILNSAFNIENTEKKLDSEVHQFADLKESKNENQKIIQEVGAVENPNLSSFHVIDSETDLDVPSGIEGPIPAVVLPPPDVPRNYVSKPYDKYSELDQLSYKNLRYPPQKIYQTDRSVHVVVYQNGQAVYQNGQAVNQNGQTANQNGQSVSLNGHAAYENGQAVNQNDQATNHNAQTVYQNAQLFYQNSHQYQDIPPYRIRKGPIKDDNLTPPILDDIYQNDQPTKTGQFRRPPVSPHHGGTTYTYQPRSYFYKP